MVDVDGCLAVYFAIQGDRLPTDVAEGARAPADPLTLARSPGVTKPSGPAVDVGDF